MACAAPNEDCPNCECRKDREACYLCVISDYQCGGTCRCCVESNLKNLQLGSECHKNKNRDRYCLYCDCISRNLPCYQCIKRNIPCQGTCFCCKDAGNKNIINESVEKSETTQGRKSDEPLDDKKCEKKSFLEKSMYIKKKREQTKSPIAGFASKSTAEKMQGVDKNTWNDVVKKNSPASKFEEKDRQHTYVKRAFLSGVGENISSDVVKKESSPSKLEEKTRQNTPVKIPLENKLSPKQSAPNVRNIYGHYCLHCECVKGTEPCSTCTKTKLQCRGVCACCLGSDNRLNDVQK